MTKFILDAMYYQIFIFNRDKFILENPHIICIVRSCGFSNINLSLLNMNI